MSSRISWILASFTCSDVTVLSLAGGAGRCAPLGAAGSCALSSVATASTHAARQNARKVSLFNGTACAFDSPVCIIIILLEVIADSRLELLVAFECQGSACY